MATYYVSNSGSNSNAGTSSGSPWQTISKVNGFTFTPGDIIQFNGGQTFTGTITPSVNGTSGNPITYQSYGTGNATISSPGASGVLITNISGITIQNLNLNGDTTGNTFGIYASASTNGNVKYTAGLIFNNLTITNYYAGIQIGGDASDSSASGFTNLSITNSLVHDCVSFGIGIYANSYGSTTKAFSNVNIQGNTVYNITGESVSPGGNSGSGINIGECGSSFIQNNVVHDCGASGPGSFAIWCYDCDSVIMQFNEAYNHKSTSSGDGGGFDIDGGCSNCILQYNYSHDNYGCGYFMFSYADGILQPWTNNICRYNVSVNDGNGNSAGQGGVVVGADSGTIANCYVYNNTCYQSKATSAASGFFGANIATATGIFSNNILYTASAAKLFQTIGTNPSAMVITGNCYFNSGTFSLEWNGTTYTTFAAWQAATSKELISSVNVANLINPLLVSPGTAGVSNYKLQNISPQSIAGLKIPGVYSLSVGTQDYFGNAIPNTGGNYSIGAHQPIRTTGRIFF